MAGEYDGIIDKVKKAAEEFVTLKVTTIVGRFEFDENDKIIIATGTKPKIIHSEINIADGDIVTYIDEDHVDTAQSPVRTFHDAQVLAAKTTVQNTIEAVKALAETVGMLIAKRDGTA